MSKIKGFSGIKNIKVHKEDFILLFTGAILFLLVAYLFVSNVTFLADKLNGALGTDDRQFEQTIRFNLDAAKNLGLD